MATVSSLNEWPSYSAYTRWGESKGKWTRALTVLMAPGATLRDIFRGGHIAYAADPDGHVWEFA